MRKTLTAYDLFLGKQKCDKEGIHKYEVLIDCLDTTGKIRLTTLRCTRCEETKRTEVPYNPTVK